ncbi:Serine/threonine-protein phosphatase 2A activator 2 [Marasmius tenuissimus]|uniref:Serine/threonine-protein phosphatase 2A activator n=1 Tax=Marasmius tenuissimus TaxID=585030 RepID=A0ABR2ZCM1_9AGAR
MTITTTTFHPPRKALLSQSQLEWFQTSETHKRIITFVETLNQAIVGAKLGDACEESDGVKAILGILSRVEEIVKDTPAVENSASRFGNPAFRTFYDQVQEVLNERDRICLEHLGVLRESDHKALVMRVFWRYIKVMRTLQSTYWLEPAGSHGVWGLDDYHFLPFLWGAAQLKGHKYIRPKSIHDAEIVDEYAKQYIYFACIQFINSIKTASLRWHSPMLDDISAVKTWDKVNQGMIKMYLAEVLNKLPVMQHFLFGSVLPYDGPLLPLPLVRVMIVGMDIRMGVEGRGVVNGKVINGNVERNEELGGAGQREVGWGDCCGIPVPSAFGAAAAAGEKQPGTRLAGPGIRPVPFD